MRAASGRLNTVSSASTGRSVNYYRGDMFRKCRQHEVSASRQEVSSYIGKGLVGWGQEVFFERVFRRDAGYSWALRSTFRPRNRTPSASSRSRCSIAESPVNLIAPPAPNTRCQGNPKPRRKTRATIRAAPGYPAIFATPPYVDTFPRGIARIARSIRSRIAPVCSVFFLALFIPEHSRPARKRTGLQLEVSQAD